MFRRPFLTACLIWTAIVFCSRVCGDEVPSAKSDVARRTVQFQKDTFHLAWVHENRQDGHHETINEYVLAGEKLERWTKLLAVRTYAGRQDFRPLAGRLVEVVKQHNPLAGVSIMRKEDDSQVMVDFLTWDVEQKIAEFNIFLYQLAPNGQDTLVQQYALRAYGDEIEDFMVGLKERRPLLLDAVTSFTFPPVTHDPVPEKAPNE